MKTLVGTETLGLDFFIKLKRESTERVIYICMSLGLMANGFVCPECGRNMALKQKTGRCDKVTWACRTQSAHASAHRVVRSVRSGSYFEDSKMSIPDILLLTHLLVNRAKRSFIKSEMGVTAPTVRYRLGSIREVCLEECLRMTEPIGGAGTAVEIDESQFGKLDSKRRYGAEGKWVFGGIECGSNKCFFKLADTRDKRTVLDVIETMILPGTTVYSVRCWKSHDCLEADDLVRLGVERDLRFEKLEIDARTNATDGIWSALRRALRGRAARGHFDSRLAEYVWRLAHSNTRDLTRAFLAAVARTYPFSTNDED